MAHHEDPTKAPNGGRSSEVGEHEEAARRDHWIAEAWRQRPPDKRTRLHVSEFLFWLQKQEPVRSWVDLQLISWPHVRELIEVEWLRPMDPAAIDFAIRALDEIVNEHAAGYAEDLHRDDLITRMKRVRQSALEARVVLMEERQFTQGRTLQVRLPAQS